MKTISDPENSQSPSCGVRTFIQILRPFIRINQLCGLCPLEISGHNIRLRYKSFRSVHTLITLLILTIYFIFALFQFVCSFGRGRRVPEIVPMAIWVTGTFVPIAMLITAIQKRQDFMHFFEKSNEFRLPLKEMIMRRQGNTVSFSRKLFGVYTILTLVSCLFTAMDVVNKPNGDIFVLAYIKSPSPFLVTLSCIFQCYLVVLRSCGCAFIEVLCCCIGTSFRNTVNSIIDEMHGLLGVTPTPVYRRHKNSLEQNNGFRLQSQRQQRRKAIFNLEETREEIRSSFLISNLISGSMERYVPIKDDSDDSIYRIPSYPKFRYSNDLGNKPEMENSAKNNNLAIIQETGPILKAIKKFNCISSMQVLLNRIFGTILALDIGLLVLDSCLLLYLMVHYLGRGRGSLHYTDGFTFVGNCILYFSRLVIVFVSLGNVHEMSIHFNDCVTTSLLNVENPEPCHINLILSHLTSQFANPCCFNAAGFFIFSRASLLAVLGAIMSYVIVLLQAKM